MLKKQQAEKLSLQINLDNSDNLLYVENALNWINENTNVKMDFKNLDKAPATARLFVSKYYEIMQLPVGISSESAGGLSQSFESKDRSEQLFAIAEAIFGAENLTIGQVTFVPAVRSWDYGC